MRTCFVLALCASFHHSVPSDGYFGGLICCSTDAECWSQRQQQRRGRDTDAECSSQRQQQRRGRDTDALRRVLLTTQMKVSQNTLGIPQLLVHSS